MISMISSVGKNMELGKDNKLIWRIPNDMKYFKNTTMGHIVVMGFKTYASIPGNLPGRHMIVLTSKKNIEQVEIVHSIDDILDRYLDLSEEIFVIGGATLYKQFLEYASKLYLTEIEAFCDKADAYFPCFDREKWDKEIISNDQYNDIKYNICVYTRKKVNKR